MNREVWYDARFYIHAEKFRRLCAMNCWFQSCTTREYDIVLDEVSGELSSYALYCICEKILRNQGTGYKYDKVEQIMALVIHSAGSVHFVERPFTKKSKILKEKVMGLFKK